MKDRLTGRWLVSEYVYNPDGSFAGTLRQRRYLDSRPDGSTRVTQYCEPDAALEGHPMASFAGEWVFELAFEGRLRRYLGPDVYGIDTRWEEGIITGRGVWPRFGHNYTSYAVMVGQGRQITVAHFYNASALIATIAGVVVPETEDSRDHFPGLEGPYDPLTRSELWSGAEQLWTLEDGASLDKRTRQRFIRRAGGVVTWEEKTGIENRSLRFTPRGDRLSISGDGEGVAMRFGPLLEAFIQTDGDFQEISECYDPGSQHIVRIVNGWRDGIPYLTGCTLLYPVTEEDTQPSRR